VIRDGTGLAMLLAAFASAVLDRSRLAERLV